MVFEGLGLILPFYSYHSGIACISCVSHQYDSGFGELSCRDPARLCPKDEEMSPYLEAQAIESMGICRGVALA